MKPRLPPVTVLATVAAISLCDLLPGLGVDDVPGVAPADNDLTRRFHTVADAVGTEPTAIAVWDTDHRNAFAAGPSNVVVITTATLDVLTDDELDAILAHELAHVRNSDPMRVATTAGVGLSLARLVGQKTNRRGGLAAAIGAFTAVAAGATLGVFAVSRRIERTADDRAAEAVSPEALAGALATLVTGDTDCRAESLVTDGDDFEPLATHPSVSERIETLLDRVDDEE